MTQNWSSGSHLEWEGKDPNARISINRFSEDGGLVKAAGLQLVQGRDIDLEQFPTDSTACLINQTALKSMGFTSAIGQIIEDYPGKWHVVGVIKDFLQESPYDPIRPLIIKGPRASMGVLQLRLSNNRSITQNLDEAQKIFHQYNPAYPFEYYFTDEAYAVKFNSEKLTARLAALFGGLTILIACLGLFGLAAYMAESRIKEIGVRKVLGASVAHIAALLSKEFVQLVLAALIIATPVAWWVMNKWLQGYQYRVDISPLVFLTAGVLAIVIALLTVGYQAVKAALASPVKNLRTE
jgi:ABC-type antimicrobial peptide transport system permease subunit